ncbi:hypothetical protein Tcan_11756 [Toxocara canis]|uniref:Uncharacterized protein n=1 Tax=Toxocara canis TaxID=6265 RepID=A0A0B2UWH9_TOXCA|nr:hypothetical protein Tcan_11756 [Toxocara canis]
MKLFGQRWMHRTGRVGAKSTCAVGECREGQSDQGDQGDLHGLNSKAQIRRHLFAVRCARVNLNLITVLIALEHNVKLILLKHHILKFAYRSKARIDSNFCLYRIDYLCPFEM